MQSRLFARRPVLVRRAFIRWVAKPANTTLAQLATLAAPGFCLDTLLAAQRGWDPCCTLSFDCDFPRDVEILPQVVDLLDKRDFKASFACIGQWIQKFPDEHRLLVGAGHEIVNHTHTHPNLYHPGYAYARHEELSRERFNSISAAQREVEINRCHQVCADVLDCEPIGFRSPHFGVLHVDDVYPMLSALGYRYSSSKMAAASPTLGLPYVCHPGIWELPLSPCPQHPFGVFDSWHSIGKENAAHAGVGGLAALFTDLAERVMGGGGYVNVYFDPLDAVESGEFGRILEFLSDSGLRVAAYRDLIGQLDATVANSG